MWVAIFRGWSQVLQKKSTELKSIRLQNILNIPNKREFTVCTISPRLHLTLQVMGSVRCVKWVTGKGPPPCASSPIPALPSPQVPPAAGQAHPTFCRMAKLLCSRRRQPLLKLKASVSPPLAHVWCSSGGHHPTSPTLTTRQQSPSLPVPLLPSSRSKSPTAFT